MLHAQVQVQLDASDKEHSTETIAACVWHGQPRWVSIAFDHIWPESDQEKPTTKIGPAATKSSPKRVARKFDLAELGHGRESVQPAL